MTNKSFTVTLIMLFFLLQIVGCGLRVFGPIYRVDSELNYQFAKFEMEMRNRKVTPRIDFLTVEIVDTLSIESEAGNCHYGIFGNNIVKIKRSYWELSSDDLKEEIMFHELGHCLLDKRHDDTQAVDQNETIPKSVVTTYLFDASIYSRHHEYYMKELFGN